jgi:hypothetical protein
VGKGVPPVCRCGAANVWRRRGAKWTNAASNRPRANFPAEAAPVARECIKDEVNRTRHRSISGCSKMCGARGAADSDGACADAASESGQKARKGRATSREGGGKRWSETWSGLAAFGSRASTGKKKLAPFGACSKDSRLFRPESFSYQ